MRLLPKGLILAITLVGLVLGYGIPAAGSAANIYIAQSAAGAADGADCNDAYAASFFNTRSNWGSGSTQIGPGTTVHYCGTGTFTAGSPALTFQGSGTSGNPITLVFAAGAVMQAPYFPGNPQEGSCSSDCGAIQAINRQYSIIDGGTKGGIQNTLNGSPTMTCLGGTCSNQQASVGVYAGGSYNIIRNFTINNIYISCGATNCSDASNAEGNNAAIRVDNGSTNTYICNNSTGNSYYGITTDTADSGGPSLSPSCSSNSTPSGFHIFQNTLADHCHHIQPNGQGAINIWMNDVSNWSDWIWPGTGNGCHTDGMISFSDSTTEVAPNVYDNYFHGDLGLGSPTGMIYCATNLTNGGSACTVFNNLLVGAGSMLSGNDAWMYVHASALGPMKYYNNTLVNGGFSLDMDGDTVTPYTFENNIFIGNGTAWAWHQESTNQPWSTLTFTNYNDFYDLNSNGWNWNGVMYQTLAGWTSGCKGGTGGGSGTCDDASSTSNPNLTSNYYLQSGSPAIGLGANLTSLGITPLNYGAPSTYGVGSVFNGVARPASGAWDAGAYEYQATAPAPPTGVAAVAH